MSEPTWDTAREGRRPYRYERAQRPGSGVLETVNGRLVCHACGRDYVALDVHARQMHGLMSREYRLVYGLRQSVALKAEDLCRRYGANLARFDKPSGEQLATIRELTRTPYARARNVESQRGKVIGPESIKKMVATKAAHLAAADTAERMRRQRHYTKLGEVQVREILRVAKRPGGPTYQDLAVKYGVSRFSIGRVVRRELWKDVEPAIA